MGINLYVPCPRIDPVEGLSWLDPYGGPEDPIIGEEFDSTHDPRQQPTPETIRDEGQLIQPRHTFSITSVEL